MMHAAVLERSDRLQRVLDLLTAAKGQWLSTWEIQQGARTCATGTCVAEIRANGIPVECRREGKVWRYKLAP